MKLLSTYHTNLQLIVQYEWKAIFSLLKKLSCCILLLLFGNRFFLLHVTLSWYSKWFSMSCWLHFLLVILATVSCWSTIAIDCIFQSTLPVRACALPKFKCIRVARVSTVFGIFVSNIKANRDHNTFLQQNSYAPVQSFFIYPQSALWPGSSSQEDIF